MQVQDVARTADESKHPDQWGGLVASSAMIEGGGSTAFDWSGSGNAAALTGSPTWSNSKYGKAMTLNGSSQYGISAAPVTSLPCTLTAWVRPTSIVDVHRIVTIGVAGSASHLLSLTIATYGALAQHFDGATNAGATGAMLTAGTWYGLCAVFRSTSYREIRVNKVATTNSTSATAPSGLNYCGIGVLHWSTGYIQNFAGDVLDARCYDREVSSAEWGAIVDAGPNAHLIRRRRRSAFAVTLSAGGVWVPINQSIMVGGGIL